jgi:hypothetical protein
MDIIQHRVNDLSMLKRLNPAFGAEIDIRSRQGRLILAHEPHHSGPTLRSFLALYARRKIKGTLILNTKEDGHEEKILNLMNHYKLSNFFFLDLTLPTLVRLAIRQREPRVALRVSEFEPPEATQAFVSRARWIWLDCFSGRPFSVAAVRRLRQKFKVCLVSPELQGYGRESISRFKILSRDIDTVCTKFPDAWQ